MKGCHARNAKIVSISFVWISVENCLFIKSIRTIKRGMMSVNLCFNHTEIIIKKACTHIVCFDKQTDGNTVASMRDFLDEAILDVSVYAQFIVS